MNKRCVYGQCVQVTLSDGHNNIDAIFVFAPGELLSELSLDYVIILCGVSIRNWHETKTIIVHEHSLYSMVGDDLATVDMLNVLHDETDFWTLPNLSHYVPSPLNQISLLKSSAHSSQHAQYGVVKGKVVKILNDNVTYVACCHTSDTGKYCNHLTKYNDVENVCLLKISKPPLS